MGQHLGNNDSQSKSSFPQSPPIPRHTNVHLQITMALEALYMVSTVTTKISILLFYRRLAVGSVTNTFIRCVHTAIAFVIVYFIVFTTTLYLGCRPFNAYWMQVDPHWLTEHRGKYKCINEATSLTAVTVVSVVQDFIAVGMPMTLFWQTRLPKRQKIMLGLIFGLGFLYASPIITLSHTNRAQPLHLRRAPHLLHAPPLLQHLRHDLGILPSLDLDGDRDAHGSRVRVRPSSQHIFPTNRAGVEDHAFLQQEASGRRIRRYGGSAGVSCIRGGRG